MPQLTSHMKAKHMLAGAATAAAVLIAVTASAQDAPRRPNLDVPYVPTRPVVVDAMLQAGEVGPKDFLIDLGSGDGRIPVTAAKRFGTTGVGVDLNPERIKEARANAANSKVEGKVTFIEGDLFKADLSKATVITLYLLPNVNLKLRPSLLDLKPGTRIVSHDFDMGDWPSEQTREVQGSTVYRWTVPAKVDGAWIVTPASKRRIEVAFKQSYSKLEGTATVDGKATALQATRIKGAAVDFTVELPNKKLHRFQGTLQPDGTLKGTGWQAARSK